MYKQEFGQRGENIAAKHYQSLGYQVIYQNYYTRYGELDLVLKKDDKILVVEVKTRTNDRFGWGEEAVSQKKLNHLVLAYQIMQREMGLPEYFEIEICAIEISRDQTNIRTFII